MQRSLKHTINYWVYKLTIEQVALIFENKDYSCFGLFFRQRKLSRFLDEYNRLFNKGAGNKELSLQFTVFKMYTKQMKLRAMYDSLIYSETAENAKKEYKLLFGKDYEGVDDLNKLVSEANRLTEKIKLLERPQKETEDKNSIGFAQLVVIVESSRGIPIDRKIKLFEFKKMYEIELEKWHKT